MKIDIETYNIDNYNLNIMHTTIINSDGTVTKGVSVKNGEEYDYYTEEEYFKKQRLDKLKKILKTINNEILNTDNR